MKKIFLFIFIVVNCYGWEFNKSHLLNLTDEEKGILQTSYFVGSQYDLGLTLAAIAIVETRIGKYHRPKTNICGYHQVATRNVVKRAKESYDSDNYLTKLDACNALKSNPYFSANSALIEFQFWMKVRDDNWRHSVRSYNVGYTDDPYQWTYLARVQKVIKILQKHTNLWLA